MKPDDKETARLVPGILKSSKSVNKLIKINVDDHSLDDNPLDGPINEVKHNESPRQFKELDKDEKQ